VGRIFLLLLLPIGDKEDDFDDDDDEDEDFFVLFFFFLVFSSEVGSFVSHRASISKALAVEDFMVTPLELGEGTQLGDQRALDMKDSGREMPLKDPLPMESFNVRFKQGADIA
jgi:hypothetical protein